ncbi:hypothetical protein JF710_21825 [Mycobacterium intracellulare]|uniref:hypothetical protein n=1 Tax=Mycobacterium intracellulare TaxID=1767 RepID=UPI001CDB44DA|nr:hypothetical protein [Mycobacterium intracellulare]MCA2255823.1 hypothetical protein [Mycobacterium intracellulare]
MHVEQLFVETLIDIDQKLRRNPSEYDLLKVAGLLRPILLEKLLDDASAAAGLDAKFRVVKPGPLPIPPEVKKQMDEAWARLHATNPEIKRVDIAVSVRPDLLSGELGPTSQPGDQVVELARKDFLKHAGVLIFQDYPYTVEHILRVAANSLGGIHWGPTNWNAQAEQLRQYMEGSVWFGRPLPAALMGAIGDCTLRACKPVADELTRRGLYSPAASEWVWSANGHCSVRADGTTGDAASA